MWLKALRFSLLVEGLVVLVSVRVFEGDRDWSGRLQPIENEEALVGSIGGQELVVEGCLLDVLVVVVMAVVVVVVASREPPLGHMSETPQVLV